MKIGSQDLPMLTQLSSHSEVDKSFKWINRTLCDVYNYEIKSRHVPMMQLHLQWGNTPQWPCHSYLVLDSPCAKDFNKEG